jgi:hypothetical protein
LLTIAEEDIKLGVTYDPRLQPDFIEENIQKMRIFGNAESLATVPRTPSSSEIPKSQCSVPMSIRAINQTPMSKGVSNRMMIMRSQGGQVKVRVIVHENFYAIPIYSLLADDNEVDNAMDITPDDVLGGDAENEDDSDTVDELETISKTTANSM